MCMSVGTVSLPSSISSTLRVDARLEKSTDRKSGGYAAPLCALLSVSVSVSVSLPPSSMLREEVRLENIPDRVSVSFSLPSSTLLVDVRRENTTDVMSVSVSLPSSSILREEERRENNPPPTPPAPPLRGELELTTLARDEVRLTAVCVLCVLCKPPDVGGGWGGGIPSAPLSPSLLLWVLVVLEGYASRRGERCFVGLGLKMLLVLLVFSRKGEEKLLVLEDTHPRLSLFPRERSVSLDPLDPGEEEVEDDLREVGRDERRRPVCCPCACV